MGRPGHWNGGMNRSGEVGFMRGTAGAGVGPDGHDLGRQAFPEGGPPGGAGIPISTIGIEDPERGPPARWTGPTACDDDIGGLPHDVAAEPVP